MDFNAFLSESFSSVLSVRRISSSSIVSRLSDCIEAADFGADGTVPRPLTVK